MLSRAIAAGLACALVFSVACGDDPAANLNKDGGGNGGADAVVADGTTSPDGGGNADGTVADGSTDSDGAVVDTDGSTSPDGNVDTDGATSPDATVDTDGAAGPDGTVDDTGTGGTDGGGGGPDAGPGMDALSPLDSGFLPDAGPDPNGTMVDFDCDGVSDAEEFMLGTDPASADTDGDGLIDGIELGKTAAVVGTSCAFVGDSDPGTTTDPKNRDTDGDHIDDGTEDRNHNGAVDSTELNPNAADTDGDGLSDDTEDQNRDGVRELNETDGTLVDSDGDGIPDGVEDRNHNGTKDLTETDPLLVDTDADGIPDGVEDADHDGIVDPTETNPTLFDSDSDGLRDGCEDRNQNGRVDPGEPDPRVRDTDFDGIDDGFEDRNGNCALDATETDPASSDSDCDGLSDLTELATVYAGGGHTNPRVVDSDGDLISDGVEASATALVPHSGCSGVAFDLAPTNHTNPTVVDSDGDGRSDGCEDRNRNGRVDSGEMNPLATDTDGDGISDALEDRNNNCVRDPNETSAALADTDGDGIGDNVEITLGTDPTRADTDGDGLPDGLEDANQNGIVEPGETNPLNRDTDGDTIPDGTEDANHNGTVDAGETDPRQADTDHDGLSDSAEATRGTNPLLADTDGDGLLDGDEVIRGTNPLVADTDGDGISDGDEVIAGTNPLDRNDPGTQGGSGINAVCSPAALRPVQFQNNPSGDWELALETSYTYTAATVTGGDFAATASDNTLGIDAFVMNIAPPVAANTNPTTQAQALIARVNAGAATLGASAVATINNGRQITSSDGFGTVVDVRIQITTSAAVDPSTIRNRVMAVLSNHAVANFTGLPAAGGATSTTFILRFAALVRTGAATRIVTHGAVVSLTNFNSTVTVHHDQVEDLSNGTALARAYATDATGCDQFLVNRTPSADFLWMADISGSTDNDRTTIATASALVFDGLTANGIDFRMGVVPHSNNHLNLGTGNGGVMRSGFTRNRTTFVNDLNNTAGTDGCEYGLTAIDDAIVRALPRTAVGTEVSTRLRTNAQLVVFYISDEHAQELESGNCTTASLNVIAGPTTTGQNDGARTTPSAAQQTAIDGIVNPFTTRVVNNAGIAFGQITPLQTPFCTDNEDGRGYFEVITRTGGTFYRTCDAAPGTVLTDMVNAVSAAASQFVLAETPISMSIKVGITRAGSTMTTIVPRNQVDGFSYDPAANTVFFHGTTYRPALNDRVTVSYRVYHQVQLPVTCTPPLVLNTITNQCDCPATCGVAGGCTNGQICDRNPAVCACTCEPDCGGRCGGSTTCDQNTCACVCAPNCGGSCTGNQVCNQAACTCSCPANCGGACTGNRTCNPTSCACECAPNCGGTCGSNQVCDLASCSCQNVSP
ncbi:MAG: hypothetical protein U1E65_04305 [Myxococcota bacterium]